jgi:thermostable 8-oxoguanine DNA glycosylase
MIDPSKITNYNRTEEELEEFLLFTIMVAGKSAMQTAKKLNEFLYFADNKKSPLDTIIDRDNRSCLLYAMRMCKLGQYDRLEKAFKGIIQFKNRLKSVTIDELESVAGIGSKTSRFFTLHSRPNQQIAVLDTHILKYMASKGYKVPKSTPPKNKYGAIEEQFIQLAKDNNMSVAEFDLQVWRSYSEK